MAGQPEEQLVAPLLYKEKIGGHFNTPLSQEIFFINFFSVDTENASKFETVSINGHKGPLMVKDSMATMVWEMDSRILMVQTQTSKDTAMKIAKE